MDSILNTIKKMLGLEADNVSFDTDILVAINSVLSALSQLGIGPVNAYKIDNAENTWAEFFGEATDLESVKLYIFFKVRLAFDPPGTSYLIDAINRQISELEWRFTILADSKQT